MHNITSFKKGKAVGRPKGKLNRVTGNLREFINGLLDNNREQIQADFLALEGKDRIAFFEKLLKYVLPTLQAESLFDFEKMTDAQLNEIIKRLKNNGNN